MEISAENPGKEKELQELRKAVETLKSSAQTAVEDSDRTFTEIIHFIEKSRSEVKEQIRAHEKAEVSRTEGLLKQLEQEISELKRRDAELEQLSHTEDHIHFLKTFESEVQAILPSEPTTREEFLQYSCHFTLDPITACRYLHLSEGNRRVD
ncbi:tripartite motif-containing protein 16-like [Alosa sapidissima]|uniref:tripartite motif-containing protein 16-like n=1 Tax=Alosa sapidissima TaxID=34773 RepID=UPI001C09C1F5|nr:tripartite motif-containing protein 16-like [Alosa sapidissima]